MKRARRSLIWVGIDDLIAHRLEYFVPTIISLVVVCAPLMFIGYLLDDAGSFDDSVGAGIGMLVGLVLWIGLVVAFVTTGAGQGWVESANGAAAPRTIGGSTQEERSAERPSTE